MIIRDYMLKVQLIALFVSIQFFGFSGYAFATDYCFEEAGQVYNISPALLWAISKEESGFDPYAVNVNQDGTYDYGHMQINSWWANKVGAAVWASLGDPCQCTKVGAWILSECIRKHGYTWEGVGCYHAKKRGRRVWYAWKIKHVLNSMGQNL